MALLRRTARRRAAAATALTLVVAGLGACATAPAPTPPPRGERPISPAVRSVAERLRPALRELAGDGALSLAVAMGGSVVWREAFGQGSNGAAADRSTLYPLNDLTDLLAAIVALDRRAPGTGDRPRFAEAPPAWLDALPPRDRWSCELLVSTWREAGFEALWPDQAVRFLHQAGAVGIRTAPSCSGWSASAPALARLGAALARLPVGPRVMGDPTGATVRTVAAPGEEGTALLLVDFESNVAVALLTDRRGPRLARQAAAVALAVRDEAVAALAPSLPPGS